MTDLLWQKPGVALDERIQRFCAGDDVLHDRALILYDIQASIAHVKGLARIGMLHTELKILSLDEAGLIVDELLQLADEIKAGSYVLDQPHEDMHSAIEARLIEKLGDVGRKVHTGRSRNDQVLVAVRLYLRDALMQLQMRCAAIARTALARAQSDLLVPMPGYTHLQRAMPSSAGMWWAGFAEGFIDNVQLVRDTLHWINANPLGSGSGYGVNLPLDRNYTTSMLGFERVQLVVTYAQLSRGKFELQALQALSQALLDLRRLAWDLSLFASQEFGFVTLPAQYTTGSSLMPNKRNPDLIELLRASYAIVSGARNEIEQLLSLPSGYHRDLQFSKAPLLRAFSHGLNALDLVPDLLSALRWNNDALNNAFDDGMFATDKAIELAASGVPFRDAYRQAVQSPLPSFGNDPAASIKARTSPGAGINLDLQQLIDRLDLLEDEE